MASYGTEEQYDLISQKTGKESLLSSITYQISKTMKRKHPVKLSSYDITSQKSRRYKSVNQYRIIKDLGFGATSKVVLAQDNNQGKFAIKIIK